ncbi:MAG: hypothetical protein ABIN48_08300 [Ginsengibacter sp.]
MPAFEAWDCCQEKAAIDAAANDGEWHRSYCSKEEEPKLNTTMIFVNTSFRSVTEWGGRVIKIVCSFFIIPIVSFFKVAIFLPWSLLNVFF